MCDVCMCACVHIYRLSSCSTCITPRSIVSYTGILTLTRHLNRSHVPSINIVQSHDLGAWILRLTEADYPKDLRHHCTSLLSFFPPLPSSFSRQRSLLARLQSPSTRRAWGTLLMWRRCCFSLHDEALSTCRQRRDLATTKQPGPASDGRIFGLPRISAITAKDYTGGPRILVRPNRSR